MTALAELNDNYKPGEAEYERDHLVGLIGKAISSLHDQIKDTWGELWLLVPQNDQNGILIRVSTSPDKQELKMLKEQGDGKRQATAATTGTAEAPTGSV